MWGMFESQPFPVSADASEPISDAVSAFGPAVQLSGAAARPYVPADELAPLSPAERIAYLRHTIDGPIMFTHGFGIEGQLLFHWIVERDIDIDVVALDTGRLFSETYELWEQTERRYGRRIRAIYPNHAAVEQMVAREGINGFYESRQARLNCCDVRKTRPLDQALEGAAAWIAGLRSDQNSNRRDGGLVSYDAARGLLKLNPLYDWTREAVLAEVKAHDVPISALHARGFASIGCAPCTRAVAPGEPERAGRWWWESDSSRECGLHMPRKRAAKDSAPREPLTAGAGCG
jgi:phosphoadenosine phosphosulfate reductase